LGDCSIRVKGTQHPVAVNRLLLRIKQGIHGAIRLLACSRGMLLASDAAMGK
jgi:hypothetical protein